MIIAVVEYLLASILSLADGALMRFTCNVTDPVLVKRCFMFECFLTLVTSMMRDVPHRLGLSDSVCLHQVDL